MAAGGICISLAIITILQRKKKEAGPMDLFTRLEAEPNYGSARYRGKK